ncbi:MAG TPA: GntR family transcriptional regulator [Gaiellaceae bacterium]|nr:GntR family transcriptional regulator [Gaiellaceae bacterium]
MPRGNTASSQTTKATLGLRELVLEGELAPGGRVPEVELAERLGVSRTPLRIALATLAHEGLLEPLAGGGFVVRAFTHDDVVDAIELRGVLEGTAARLAAERLGSRRELVPLEEAVAELDPVVDRTGPEALVRFVALNERFHEALVALAKSPVVARSIANVVALPFASPNALLSSHALLPRSHEILVVAQHQHRALLEAIADGHGTRAEEIAREHARLARRNLDLVLADRDALAAVRGAPLLRSVAGG